MKLTSEEIEKDNLKVFIQEEGMERPHYIPRPHVIDAVKGEVQCWGMQPVQLSLEEGPVEMIDPDSLEEIKDQAQLLTKTGQVFVLDASGKQIYPND